MVRYPLVWTPVVFVLGTVVLLSNAYLALIALTLVALIALPALTLAIVAVPYLLVRSIGRRWEERSAANHPRTALSLAERKSA